MKSLLTVKAPASQHGFSLMEMAVVLMILGTLMSGVLVAVSQTTENNRRTNALVQLRQIEEALYGFAQTYGRLPCPAIYTTVIIKKGKEDPQGGGNCTEPHGFVPVATLGFYGPTNDDGLLLDPWQNPVRYSVAEYDDNGDSIPDFTTDAGIIFASGNLAPDPDLLKVCDRDGCIGNVVADTVPAIVYSMGANWATYTSADEQENADPATLLANNPISDDNEFVSTSYSEENFDDQLIWLSPYVLFNKLITAGKLP
jgi:prepilin-type N-terminal cleavage/methylation domain-containing protein